MDLLALRHAAEFGGTVLSGASSSQSLVLVERPVAHGLPCLLLLGRKAEDLATPLGVVAEAQSQGLRLNVGAVLPGVGTDWPLALAHHRRRLGSLVGALDVGLPWLEGQPMMAKRLPGRIRAQTPLALPPAHLRPLEHQELRTFLGGWEDARFEATFLQPPWRAEGNAFDAPLWPEVPVPPGAEVVEAPLVLPSATPFTEALRGALRATAGQPIPWLPHPGEAGPCRGLLALTPAVAVFQGTPQAWLRAFEQIAALPAPPHFCARC